MPIELDEQELLQRPAHLRRMLKVLRGTRELSCKTFLDSGKPARVIAAHEGGVSGIGYREWTFRTIARTLEAQYFELWHLKEKQTWYMDRAYLHLFEINRQERTRRELLAIHTDPYDFEAFKRGPHLHVRIAPSPFPDCHFPLNKGHLQDVLAACATLTDAIESAFEIIAQEVLRRY